MERAPVCGQLGVFEIAIGSIVERAVDDRDARRTAERATDFGKGGFSGRCRVEIRGVLPLDESGIQMLRIGMPEPAVATAIAKDIPGSGPG